jgi:hypothetical protein
MAAIGFIYTNTAWQKIYPVVFQSVLNSLNDYLWRGQDQCRAVTVVTSPAPTYIPFQDLKFPGQSHAVWLLVSL